MILPGRDGQVTRLTSVLSASYRQSVPPFAGSGKPVEMFFFSGSSVQYTRRYSPAPMEPEEKVKTFFPFRTTDQPLRLRAEWVVFFSSNQS